MPGQQQPGVLIQPLGEHIQHRGDVLAGHGVVRAAAAHLQIAPAAREQRHPHRRKRLLQIAGHLAIEQLGGPAQAGGHRLLQRLPLRPAGGGAAQAHPIGGGP